MTHIESMTAIYDECKRRAFRILKNSVRTAMGKHLRIDKLEQAGSVARFFLTNKDSFITDRGAFELELGSHEVAEAIACAAYFTEKFGPLPTTIRRKGDKGE